MKKLKNYNHICRLMLYIAISASSTIFVGCNNKVEPKPTRSIISTITPPEPTRSIISTTTPPDITNQNIFPVVGARSSYPESLKEKIKRNISTDPSIKDRFPKMEICETDATTDPYFLIIQISNSESEAKKIQQQARENPPTDESKPQPGQEETTGAWILYSKDKINIKENSCRPV